MKYQRDLIGKKVLIIHNYLSIYFKSYCTYHIGKIKYYYPSCNLIIVECNDNINRTRFSLVDHDDPFAKKKLIVIYSDIIIQRMMDGIIYLVLMKHMNN